MKQSSVASHHILEDKSSGLYGGAGILLISKSLGSPGESRYHKTVPVSQGLVVSEGSYPEFSLFKKDLSDPFKTLAQLVFIDPEALRNLLRHLFEVKDVLPLQLFYRGVARFCGGKELNGTMVVFAVQYGSQFAVFPQVELSFPAFAVRVLCREEQAILRDHVSQNILQYLLGRFFIEGVFRSQEGLGIDDCQECLVVEHLLEVRNEPLCVSGIPVEPKAHLVVDSPHAHGIESFRRHI